MSPALRRDAIVQRIRARRAARPRASAQRVPRPLPPDGQRRSYFAALRPLVARLGELLQEELGPSLAQAASRVDDDVTAVGGGIRSAIRRVARRWAREYPDADLERLAASAARGTSGFQREQWARQAQAAIGLDVTRSEPWLAGASAAFTRENVALIRSLADELLPDVEARLLAGIQVGARHEVLARSLQERLGVAESRAKLIARDQVGKFYGALAEARQKDAGVDGYIWRTVNDNRVRSEHEHLAGKRFRWDDPPAEGHPGEAVNCRCYAEPDFSGAAL